MCAIVYILLGNCVMCIQIISAMYLDVSQVASPRAAFVTVGAFDV